MPSYAHHKAKGSGALVWVEPMAGVPAFCRPDLDVGDTRCPMVHRTHPGFVAPGDAAYYRLSAGTLLAVACRFSVLAYALAREVPGPSHGIPDPHMHHWDMVPPQRGGYGCHRGHRVWVVWEGVYMSCNTTHRCRCTEDTQRNRLRKGHERVGTCTKWCTKGCATRVFRGCFFRSRIGTKGGLS